MEKIENIRRGWLWKVHFFFFYKQNPPHLKEVKNYIGGGFWMDYMNSLNLIYVVIIFFK